MRPLRRRKGRDLPASLEARAGSPRLPRPALARGRTRKPNDTCARRPRRRRLYTSPGTPMALPRGVRLTFDRGTLLLDDVPTGLELTEIAGVLWDVAGGEAPRAGPPRLSHRLRASASGRLGDRHALSGARPAVRFCGRPTCGPIKRPRSPPGGWRIAAGCWCYRWAAARRASPWPPWPLPAPPVCVWCPTRVLMGQWVAEIGQVWAGPVGRFGDGERVLARSPSPPSPAPRGTWWRLGTGSGWWWSTKSTISAGASGTKRWRCPSRPAAGSTATPAAAGPAAARLAALLGPVVFERSVRDSTGQYLAPFDRVTWNLSLGADERREYDGLREVYLRAWRLFLGNHLGSSWRTSCAMRPAPMKDGAG